MSKSFLNTFCVVKNGTTEKKLPGSVHHKNRRFLVAIKTGSRFWKSAFIKMYQKNHPLHSCLCLRCTNIKVSLIYIGKEQSENTRRNTLRGEKYDETQIIVCNFYCVLKDNIFSNRSFCPHPIPDNSVPAS